MTSPSLSNKQNYKKKFELLAFVALMTLSLWMRLRALPNYPVTEDEFITLSALKGIVSTGVPHLGEDGAIYWRALFAHYLMSIPLIFTEATVQAARIMPTLFSVLVLPVAYAGGRMLSGRTAGWLAAAFLAFSNYQNYHAAFARFYMPFQFFFLSAALLAVGYFILGRRKYGPWLLAATLATLASHALAVALLPLLVWAFLCGRRWELLRAKAFWLSVFLVAGFTWLNIFWTPEEAFVNSLAVHLKVGGLNDKWAFYETFRQYAPLGWTFIILSLIPIYLQRSLVWFYLWCGFVGEMVFISMVAPDPNVRYMSHLFSLGVVLMMASIGWFLALPFNNAVRGFRNKLRQAVAVAAVVVIGAGVHLVLAESFNVKVVFGNTLIAYNQGPAHEFMAKLVTDDDVVISMDPGMTSYYLDRPVDYLLREKFDPSTRTFSSYPQTFKGSRPEYYIDSPERMQHVLDSTRQRIWVYLNRKTMFTTSKPLRDLMEKNFKTIYSDPIMQTYVLVRY